MIRYALVLSCIVGILVSTAAAAAGGKTGNSPGAAVDTGVSADSGMRLYSSVGKSVGGHMRHMVAAGYARRISKQARQEGEPEPPSEDGRPAVTQLAFTNPAIPGADFDLSLREAGPVRLEIFSVEGRKVTTLIDRPMSAGTYSIRWEGKDARGRAVTPGVYFCRFETGDLSRTSKVVLAR